MIAIFVAKRAGILWSKELLRNIIAEVTVGDQYFALCTLDLFSIAQTLKHAKRNLNVQLIQYVRIT